MRKTQTYILKLWNDGKNLETWRASLENVQTHERQHFAELEQILIFLRAHAQTAASSENSGVKSKLEADCLKTQPQDLALAKKECRK